MRGDKGAIDTDSKEVYQFLESSMEYTSECAISSEPAFSKIGELVRDCHEGRICFSGREACEVLNSTMIGILDTSWNVGSDNGEFYYKGYEFESVYDDEEIIIEIDKGNCEGSFIGAEYPIPRDITSSFKLCF